MNHFGFYRGSSTTLCGIGGAKPPNTAALLLKGRARTISQASIAWRTICSQFPTVRQVVFHGRGSLFVAPMVWNFAEWIHSRHDGFFRYSRERPTNRGCANGHFFSLQMNFRTMQGFQPRHHDRILALDFQVKFRVSRDPVRE